MKKVNFVSFDTKSMKGIGGNPYFILVSLSLLMLLSALYFTHTSLDWERIFYTSDKEKGVQAGNGHARSLPKEEAVNEVKEEAAEFALAGNRHAFAPSNEIKEKSTDIKEEQERNGEQKEKFSVPEEGKKEVKRVASQEKVEETKTEYNTQGMQLSNKNNYFLSICRCLVKENAESALQELSNLGYTPIMQQDMTQAKMYNVYSETFEERTQAIKLLDHLKGNGFDPLLIPMPDGKYTLRILSCYYKESARDVEQRLKRGEIACRIVHEPTETTAYSVLIGGFDSVQGTKIIQDKLLHNGYKTFVLKR